MPEPQATPVINIINDNSNNNNNIDRQLPDNSYLSSRKRFRLPIPPSNPLPPLQQPEPDDGLRRSRRLRLLAPDSDIATYTPINVHVHCVQHIEDYYDAFAASIPLEEYDMSAMKQYKLRPLLNQQVQSIYLPGDAYLCALTISELEKVESSTRDQINYSVLCNAIRATRVLKTKLVNHGSGATAEDIPSSFEMALSPAFIHKYQQAIQTEVSQFVSQQALSLPIASVPHGTVVLDTKWVFDIKTDHADAFVRYKARLVVRGFLQQLGTHYTETYSPTTYIECIRLIIFLIHVCGFDQFQFDVTAAFLNADIDIDLYIQYPPGLPGYNPDTPQYAKLLKAIYGTKQASMLFWKHFRTKLLAAGYKQVANDKCLLFKRDTLDRLSLIATYVDDLPGCSQDPQEKHRLAEILQGAYDLTTKDVIEKLLGLKVYSNKDGAILYNDSYIQQLGKFLKLSHLPIANVPGEPNQRFGPNLTGKASPILHKSYRSLIGSLLFASIMWRPDITEIVSHLGTFLSNPSFEHYDAAVDVYRFLKGTEMRGIKFGPQKLLLGRDPQHPERLLRLRMICWFDADFAKNHDYRSVSGYYISIHFDHEVAIFESTGYLPRFNVLTWQSKKQREHVANSSYSAENYSGSIAARKIDWLDNILGPIGLRGFGPTPMLGDNSAHIVNANQQKLSTTERHMGMAMEQIFELVEKDKIKLYKTPGIDNGADMFTKSLASLPLRKHSEKMMGYAHPTSSTSS
jgi:hypothetical protein